MFSRALNQTYNLPLAVSCCVEMATINGTAVNPVISIHTSTPPLPSSTWKLDSVKLTRIATKQISKIP